jgi:hypothetical protein
MSNRIEEVVNELISEISEKVSKLNSENNVIEIYFKDVLLRYNLPYTTTYVVFAHLEKNLKELFSNDFDIFRRKGKIRIVKKLNGISWR